MSLSGAQVTRLWPYGGPGFNYGNFAGKVPGEDDTTPDTFSFTDQSGVALSSTITSAAITVSGIDAAADITITGGTYSINGGAYTADPGTVDNGDEVTARHTSSASYLTATNTVVTIGGVSDTFTSTTLSDPDATYTLNGGTAVTLAGQMATIFLDAVTAVPSTAVMCNGFAHHQNGYRYVCEWPSNDIVYPLGGIARRSDGAMVIIDGGTTAAYRGGMAMTYRGEVRVDAGAPSFFAGGYGFTPEGELCVTELS
jgi:hypothetical protein